MYAIHNVIDFIGLFSYASIRILLIKYINVGLFNDLSKLIQIKYKINQIINA